MTPGTGSVRRACSAASSAARAACLARGQLGVVVEPGHRLGQAGQRSAAYRLVESTCASRSAAAPESRRSLRYQCVVPIVSESLRKDSSPESGSGPWANQPSMTGSSWRWIAARRDSPSVRASMCRSAPSGSGSRWPAAARGRPPARGRRPRRTAAPSAAAAAGRRSPRAGGAPRGAPGASGSRGTRPSRRRRRAWPGPAGAGPPRRGAPRGSGAAGAAGCGARARAGTGSGGTARRRGRARRTRRGRAGPAPPAWCPSGSWGRCGRGRAGAAGR